MKVLVVEDELKTAQYLKRGLEESGFQVDVVHNGEEGLACALDIEYDLLILDVMLPGIDGWEIMTRLRAAGRRTLAIFLTARDSTEDRVKGLDLGADAYLAKPFSFSELMANIRSVMRRGPQRVTASTVEIGALVIDPVARTAVRDNVRLDLTPKEFALLLLLARRKGEILSRTTISELIWNIHFDSGSNTVDVHVRRLRAKVDDPWDQKYIRTVRSIGYVLDEPE